MVPLEDRADGTTEVKRVWDVPVRVAHALFIVCIAGAWLTRDAERIDWHLVFGYTALAAATFRIAWGFVGPTHSRFASFRYSPFAALRYVRDAMRGQASHYAGHNPAGSWAVYALLALIVATCVAGVVASGGMHSLGPLAGRVDFAVATDSLEAHEFFAWTILVVVAGHLAGVLWGSHVHHENLALAMVTGNKRSHGDPSPPAKSRAPLGAAMLLAVAFGATFYILIHLSSDVDRREADEKQAAIALAASPWTKECGSCHLAYPQALLPQASWKAMLAAQDKHFGEDLSLPEATIAKLLATTGGPSPAWGPWAIARSSRPAATADTPERITESRRWRGIHHDVPEARFKAKGVAGKHDCGACHRDAASGIFHPRMIQIAKQGTSN